jgi:hypothetical protein
VQHSRELRDERNALMTSEAEHTGSPADDPAIGRWPAAFERDLAPSGLATMTVGQAPSPGRSKVRDPALCAVVTVERRLRASSAQ